MLYGEVAQYPRAQHYYRLEPYQQMGVDRIVESVISVSQATDNDRRHEKSAEYSIEKKNGRHVVVTHRNLLHYIIQSEPESRTYCKYQPHFGCKIKQNPLSYYRDFVIGPYYIKSSLFKPKVKTTTSRKK